MSLIANKTSTTVRKIYQFLDVDPDYEFERVGQVRHATKYKVTDDALWRSLKRLKPLHSVARLIPSPPKRIVYHFLGRTVNKPKLSPEQRNFVLSELREDF